MLDTCLKCLHVFFFPLSFVYSFLLPKPIYSFVFKTCTRQNKTNFDNFMIIYAGTNTDWDAQFLTFHPNVIKLSEIFHKQHKMYQMTAFTPTVYMLLFFYTFPGRFPGFILQ